MALVLLLERTTLLQFNWTQFMICATNSPRHRQAGQMGQAAGLGLGGGVQPGLGGGLRLAGILEIDGQAVIQATSAGKM